MRTRSFLARLAGFSLLALTVVPAGHAASFDAVYTFGDSLTDVGNFLTLTSAGQIPGVPPQPLPPHYVTGRRSNGPIWIDYFTRDLGLGPATPSLLGGTDFAEAGGSETGATPLHEANFLDLTGPTGQLAQFEQAIPHPSARALYTLWIGGNDLYDVFYTLGAGGSANATAVANAAVDNVLTFVREIARLGATELLLSTVPDLGKTPEITEFYPSYITAASELASYYDRLLVSSVAAEASRDSLNLHVLDTYALLDAAVADPGRFGFSNVTDPCWTGDFLGQNGTECAHPSRYLFWDHYHATTAANRIIATAAEAALNPVPEPESAAILFSAVLGVAVVRLNRRAG